MLILAETPLRPTHTHTYTHTSAPATPLPHGRAARSRARCCFAGRNLQEWFADKLISRADNTAWLTPGTGIDATLLSGTSFLGFLGTLDVDTSLELWLNDGLNKDVKRLKEIIRQVHDDDGIKKSVPKKLTLQSLQKRIGVLFKWDPADEASKLQGPADAGQDTGGSSGCSPML